MNSSLGYHTMVLVAYFSDYRKLQCDLDRLPMIRRVVVTHLNKAKPGEVMESRLRLPGLLERLEWFGRIPTDLPTTLTPCRNLTALRL